MLCYQVMWTFEIMFCEQCGLHKSLGESLVVWKNDWMCTTCRKFNFAKNSRCFCCFKTLKGFKRGPDVAFDQDIAVKKIKRGDDITFEFEVLNVWPVIDPTYQVGCLSDVLVRLVKVGLCQRVEKGAMTLQFCSST